MTNPIEKRYLRRRSGISLEVLIKYFKESKISYSMEAQNTDEKYFRDTIINVRRELKDLFRDNVLPQALLPFLNEEEGHIELSATYNYLVLSAGVALDLLGNDYLEITPEYEKKLSIYDQRFPVDWPIDRIRIYRDLQ